VEEGIVKRLMTSVRCSACGQYYQMDGIDVLGHEEELWFLRVSCPSCHTQYLVAAIIEEERAPEAITDLSQDELEKFRNMGRLTLDDVLDMHNFLKGFDGDFSRLFSQK